MSLENIPKTLKRAASWPGTVSLKKLKHSPKAAKGSEDFDTQIDEETPSLKRKHSGDCEEHEPQPKHRKDDQKPSEDSEGPNRSQEAHTSDEKSHASFPQDAQPREWMDWSSQKSGKWQDGGWWNASEWQWPSATSGSEFDENAFMAEMEKKLFNEHANSDVPAEKTSEKMSASQVAEHAEQLTGDARVKYNDLKEALDLLESGGKLDSSHRLLLAMRKKHKDDPAISSAARPLKSLPSRKLFWARR